MKRFNSILILLGIVALPLVSQDKRATLIHIDKIDGRSWLIDAKGKPFFAHGITHIGTVRHDIDYEDVARACKELGFNAYGYGCPTELKTDMPYVEGQNHLVPISTYRSDGSFHFIDVFDPIEQERLTAKIKFACNRNRNNPNLIGYCWTDLGAWPLKNSTGKNWVEFIRELPNEAHGKKAYADFLENGTAAMAREPEISRFFASSPAPIFVSSAKQIGNTIPIISFSATVSLFPRSSRKSWRKCFRMLMPSPSSLPTNPIFQEPGMMRFTSSPANPS